MVPGLLRAGFGIGSRVAADQRPARWRPLCRQRAEDLDLACARGQHDLHAGAHLEGSAQAGRHLAAAGLHGNARHHRAADPHHRRLAPPERSLLRRGPRAGRQPGRRGGQGLDLCQVPARTRAPAGGQHRPARAGAPPGHPGGRGSRERAGQPARSRIASLPAALVRSRHQGRPRDDGECHRRPDQPASARRATFGDQDAGGRRGPAPDHDRARCGRTRCGPPLPASGCRGAGDGWGDLDPELHVHPRPHDRRRHFRSAAQRDRQRIAGSLSHDPFFSATAAWHAAGRRRTLCRGQRRQGRVRRAGPDP
ncbi:hypothetical protein VARIO8X_50294 [Burkholderiales bacterium 8X]|nr:hypothetical protein VARIO8X_50294 [Burkholderiales bacterium 8X]